MSNRRSEGERITGQRWMDREGGLPAATKSWSAKHDGVCLMKLR